MSSRIIDLTGMTFGRLIVIRMCDVRISNGKLQWECICTCGKSAIVIGARLRSGATRSCGCLQAEIAVQNGRKSAGGPIVHGNASRGKKTAEYHAWRNAKERCCNPNTACFGNYGGRGITMCDRWLGSFENFLGDMGPRPSTRHSLDRIDNNGDYEPNNCRWATRGEQARNTRHNLIVEYEGRSMTLTEASRESGIPPATLSRRLKAGWPPELIFSPTPFMRGAA